MLTPEHTAAVWRAEAPLTLLHAVDCPGWQPGTVATTRGGWTALPRAPAACRAHPVPTAVATAAVPAPAPPPLKRHQGPDPRAGRRVSIRPQPTRAPRPEAMALGPFWGRGAARAVARVPTRRWGVGGTTGGTAAAALRLPLPPGAAGVAAGGLPPPPPPLGETRGLGGGPEGEHCLLGGQRLRGARQPLALRGCPDMLTPEHTAAVWRAEAPCPREAARPPRLTRASEHAMAGRAATFQTALAPYWTRPAQTGVGTAAVPAPATPLLEWPRCPDPRPGWRLSIRPQPTRAPQGEAMALGPPRGRGPARAVARGPTLSWGAGGAAGGAAAEALRLLLAPGVTGTVAAPPPPPTCPSPPVPLRGGRRAPMSPAGNAGCLPRESGGRGSHAALPPTHTPCP